MISQAFQQKQAIQKFNTSYGTIQFQETALIKPTLNTKNLKYTPVWKDEYYNLLNDEERLEAQKIIIRNDFSSISTKTSNPKIQHFLRHYTIPRDSIDRKS